MKFIYLEKCKRLLNLDHVYHIEPFDKDITQTLVQYEATQGYDVYKIPFEEVRQLIMEAHK
jgi:hypothetical protein